MKSLSIDISDDMIGKMNKFPNIKWEEFMFSLLSEYLENLTKTDKLAANSEFTLEDADELGEMVKKTAWKSFKEKYQLK